MLLRLSDQPVKTRFIRILMKESSATSDRREVDVRDRLGYAIREIYAGLFGNKLQDEVRHASNNGTRLQFMFPLPIPGIEHEIKTNL